MSMSYEEPTLFRSNIDGASEQAGWAWQLAGGLVIVAAGLVIAIMMAGVLQWRDDVRAENVAAAQARLSWDRHDPARIGDRAAPEQARYIEVRSLQ